jgi:outer membrane protein TolC
VDEEAKAKGLPARELTLADALRLGRANNVELRAAELLPQQARQDLLFFAAEFQPELYGDVGYESAQVPARNAFQPSLDQESVDATLGWRQRVITGGLFDLAYRPGRFVTSSASGAFPERLYSSEVVATYTQPLLRGAWTDYNLANVDAARHNVNRAGRPSARSGTLLEIVVCWSCIRARTTGSCLRRSASREQLRIAEERIRVGELAPRDRIADEARWRDAKRERIVAETLIRRQEDVLRRLLFDDQSGQLWQWNLRTIDAIVVTPAPSLPDFESLVTVATARRPDLKALRSQVAEAELSLLQAERDILPALDLVGIYSSDGVADSFTPAWEDMANQEFSDWGVRLQFSVPIGNQAAQAQRRRAELELERRQRLLYGALMDVAKDVRDALRQVDRLGQSIHASGESVRLAASNLETEQAKLRVGSSTAFEVQRRNQELREARSRHLRNQLEDRIAESRLLYAQGILEVPRD